MTCACNAAYGQAHAYGCPLGTGTRHYCGPMCRANAARLRRSYARPVDPPLSPLGWLWAFLGGVVIVGVAVSLAVLGGALVVAR